MKDATAILRIKEAMALLKIRDARTFDAWCKDHQVTVFNDVGGRYIFREEFVFKIMEPIIAEMKNKYPDWHERFFMEELMKENSPPPSEKKETLKRYNPQGKNEAKFLNKLIEIATKKKK